MSNDQAPSKSPSATEEHLTSTTLSSTAPTLRQTLPTRSQPISITENHLSGDSNDMDFSEVGMPRAQPWSSPMALASGQSPSKSANSSSQSGSSKDSGRLLEASNDRKPVVERAMNKAKSKLASRSSQVQSLPDNDAEFERQKAKEMEKYRRKAEYERLKMREKTIFGMTGAGQWNS